MGNVKLLKDQKIIFKSNTLDFVPDTIRYEVHYWNKKRQQGFYIGTLDACYTLDDAQKHIDRLKLDKNITNIKLWKITESVEITKVNN